MSGHRLPAPHGDWIDRARPLRFSVNGRTVSGFSGDTVASALLAAGHRLVGRSLKLHRPRGIVCCGVEEPNALFDVGTGARRTPDTRATDIDAQEGLVCRSANAWPSLALDAAAINQRLSALLPAGFYYKTFLWPHWRLFEPAIRRMAGLGHAADAPDPDGYDHVSVRAEVLVIGGGPAGRQAALAAARTGAQVLLMEASAHLAGRAALQAAGVDCRTRCTVVGLYDHGLAVAVESLAERGGGALRERLWKIDTGRTIVAIGAFERPMLFPDNDRPGVMLAGAVQQYAQRYGVACGRQVVVATACDSGYRSAAALQAAGIGVAAIIDSRTDSGVPAPEGIAVHRASTVVAVAGRGAVRQVTIAPQAGGRIHTLAADCIASAGGWTPAVHLHSQAGGRLRWLPEASMFVPDGPAGKVVSVGACAGVFDEAQALAHAEAVGAGRSLPAPVGGLGVVPANTEPSAGARAALGRRTGPVFVDLQNDVTADDVGLAARENYRSVEHLKRYTTMGMATDQGKTSNVNALVLLGERTQRPPAEVGTTRFRPPFKPVTLNLLAAGRHGERFSPLKRMPGHAWHEVRGGRMEEFGGWLRPAAYAAPGESLVDVARAEALAVRRRVGLFEGSPLGKIEVIGPDAADFLDRMYVGTLSTLAVGAARYALLLNENGVIVDDGIVSRLGPEHFLVNTTSGQSEAVALGFEEWLQCEFVRHRVLVAPVTSAWGNVTVSGPQAWELLQAAGFDAALAPGAMRHMTLRETRHGGVGMRVLRASFSGELGYEINLPAPHTTALLERLWEAGRPFGVVAYGIEALMILRTEKGYLHVGGDTDGTTLPGDVGMDRGIAKKQSDFVGRRSLRRPAATDPERMQLVGLLPRDRRTPLPVGAHVAASRPPAPIDGYVTSSHDSPALGHPVALGMLRQGRSRLGERITVWHLGRPIEAEVAATPFFDPAGERAHGQC